MPFDPPSDCPEAYPRPQLRRPQWCDLGGRWEFAHDDADRGMALGWQHGSIALEREIIVPFPPESRASGVADIGYHPIIWYRRSFRLDPADRSARLKLHFGAVDYRASVWVNGRFAGAHEGGQTPFALEIGHLLSAESEQIIVVRAEDDPHDLAQPRGKQDWRPEGDFIFHDRTSGIWQPVWLEPLGELSIAELRWTPDVANCAANLEIKLEGKLERAARIHIRLWLRDLVLADENLACTGAETRRGFVFDPALVVRSRRDFLWSPEHPNLLQAAIEIRDADGEVLDQVASYFGMRSVAVDRGLFLLNGVPTFLRMVLAQNYWPDTHLAPPGVDAMRREVELAKQMGFNGLRIHQKFEDPRFLAVCDRLGMMVWGEAPAAFTFTHSAVTRFLPEWLAALRRDYNHPSIVTWVPFNESWGLPDLPGNAAQRELVKGAVSLTRSLDVTRPVIGNDGWEFECGDIVGIHDYSLDPAGFEERYRDRDALRHSLEFARPSHKMLTLPGARVDGQAIMITEFGGLTLQTDPAADSWGYGSAAHADDMLARYTALVGALLGSSALAGFCYTQLTDTQKERNGLLTVSRQPKIEPAKIRAVTMRPSAALAAEAIEQVQREAIERRRAQMATDAPQDEA